VNLFKPFSPGQVSEHFDRYFQKIQAKNPSRPLQVRVYAPKLSLDYSFPADSTSQPYHVASIGKLFTATLVYRLAERGRLSLQDPIARYLPPADLDGLFVYAKNDYAGQVTIEQLLAHSSGVADYFEGSTSSGKSFLAEMLANPGTHWTPGALLAFTRQHQVAVGVPGQVFNYSDTGYILLGLIIEAVTGKSFGQNLVEEIFLPLEMGDSYLMFYTEPANTPKRDLEKIWFNDVEVSRFESLSCDWAGGGIVSTTADLPAGFRQHLPGHGCLQPQVPPRDLLRPGDDGDPLQGILLLAGSPAQDQGTYRHPGHPPVLRSHPGGAYPAQFWRQQAHGAKLPGVDRDRKPAAKAGVNLVKCNRVNWKTDMIVVRNLANRQRLAVHTGRALSYPASIDCGK
jgi:D-alanyl-D-alanine carboxypeptidase